MERKTCSLKLILDKLHEGIHLSTFEDRLLLQKSIYLVQVCGIDLGYRFSWYVHGPYSPDLTETAFGYRDRRQHYDQAVKKFRLSELGESRLNKVKSMIAAKQPATLSDSRWAELLASIHYLRHIAYLPGEAATTEENIEERLKEFGKTQFTKSQIVSAWKALESTGLIRSKKLS